MPNLRVLNLNYNFLEDTQPLEGLTRLRKLTIIGSRVKTTKQLVRVLRGMVEIEMLDFRYVLLLPRASNAPTVAICFNNDASIQSGVFPTPIAARGERVEGNFVVKVMSSCGTGRVNHREAWFRLINV